MSNAITTWFKNNCVLLSDNFSLGNFSPFYSNSSYWMLEKGKVEELFKVAAEEAKYFHRCEDFDGLHNLTTPYGLVRIVATIKDEDVFEFKGLKILKMEFPREFMVDSRSKFVTQIKGLTTEGLVKIHEEWVAEEAKKKAKSEAYSKRKADLHAELLNLSTDVEWPAMVQTMFSFDHSYNYSDDGKYWRTANACRESIIASVKRFGQDGDVLLRRIANVVLN